MANKSGFIRRKSKISLKSFLDILFFETQRERCSLRRYIQSLEVHHGIGVSKEAFNRKFNSNLVSFLKDLLGYALKLQYSGSQINSHWKNVFTGIRIMDSTEFKLPNNMAEQFPGYGGDGTQSVAQIQFEYELFSNKITQLKIGHSLESDRTEGLREIDQIPPKTLILRDLGYYSMKVYQAMEERDLYYVSRVHSQVSLYEKVNDQYIQLSHGDLLRRLSHDDALDMSIYVGKSEKIPMRLLAFKLNDTQHNRRLRRANKRQTKGKSDYNWLNLFVSNIPENMISKDHLYSLYRLRWQVEIIFKTWKSHFNIHAVHKMKSCRFEAILLVKLLWVVLNQNLLNLISSASQKQISVLKFSKTFLFLLDSFRECLKGETKQRILWVQSVFAHVKYCLKEDRKNRVKTSDILLITD